VGPRAGLNSAENLPPTGIRSPDHPACSESLYRLSYPAPKSETFNSEIEIFRFCLKFSMCVPRQLTFTYIYKVKLNFSLEQATKS
jgi:hypothetical protein